jgi:hypothetical protein
MILIRSDTSESRRVESLAPDPAIFPKASKVESGVASRSSLRALCLALPTTMRSAAHVRIETTAAMHSSANASCSSTPIVAND